MCNSKGFEKERGHKREPERMMKHREKGRAFHRDDKMWQENLK